MPNAGIKYKNIIHIYIFNFNLHNSVFNDFDMSTCTVNYELC